MIYRLLAGTIAVVVYLYPGSEDVSSALLEMLVIVQEKRRNIGRTHLLLKAVSKVGEVGERGRFREDRVARPLVEARMSENTQMCERIGECEW